jgi:hypothetical protein
MSTRIVADELLAFFGAPPVAQTPLARWLGDSPRFGTFADAHREKIRKKLRSAADTEGVRDVLCELETAYVLLREPRLAVAYEAYAHRPARGPDFSLTYRTHTLCHVEAARLRAVAAPAGERLHELVCGKLGQMLPSAMNVLVIATGAALPAYGEVEQSLKQLQTRAERGDPRVLLRYHFDTRAAFFKLYTRLSAVVLRNGWEAEAPGPAVLWLNKQARQPLPDPLARALRAVFTPAVHHS